MRIALGIEYDGTAYNGWQRQRNGTGVQEKVEAALSGVANEGIEIVCAGRTDTGVHAIGQVVHFDTAARRPDHGWLLGINSLLPIDVNAVWAQEVSSDFHARFSAISRRYQYKILNRSTRSSLYRDRAWWVRRWLDEAEMQVAANALLGEHDFSAFRAAGCHASTPNRNMQLLNIVRDDEWLHVTIVANAFLQHMVRNIVGSLASIGFGERPATWLKDLLDSRDRRNGGIAAPAHGLTLIHVEYPEKFGLAALDKSAVRADS